MDEVTSARFFLSTINPCALASTIKALIPLAFFSGSVDREHDIVIGNARIGDKALVALSE